MVVAVVCVLGSGVGNACTPLTDRSTEGLDGSNDITADEENGTVEEEVGTCGGDLYV